MDEFADFEPHMTETEGLFKGTVNSSGVNGIDLSLAVNSLPRSR
jgi:hypothetical protein